MKPKSSYPCWLISSRSPTETHVETASLAVSKLASGANNLAVLLYSREDYAQVTSLGISYTWINARTHIHMYI
jgi:hypothetical protein